jgi:hypothetical protein
MPKGILKNYLFDKQIIIKKGLKTSRFQAVE